MNDENIRADHSFINNGNFLENLDGWIINDERKVTRQSGEWQDKSVGFMNAANTGEGYQTITLASSPHPEPGKANYKLIFHYEAVSGAEGTLRINPGLGGEVDLKLVPSLKANSEKALDPDVRLELNLAEYTHALELESTEETVKFTVISPDNGEVGRPGAVRVAFVRVELLLEPLRLTAVTIDGEPQSPTERLHLCFGANHSVVLQSADDSVWKETQAGMLVNGGDHDPENILTANPQWGREQVISAPWTLKCAGIVEDKEVDRTLAVRSQYTADLYLLEAVCGHFQLDVIPLQEAAYYPVIDLNQSVDLCVRVASHFTKTPLENREVTWTLKVPGEADIELLKVFSDKNGEAGINWTPDTEGDWEIVASVDSHYKKEDARYSFKVRVLKDDPWLSATFEQDGSEHGSVWGSGPGYPCRGGTHQVTLAFPSSHLLADTDLALHWSGDDTPEGLGVVITPELDAMNPIDGPGLTWNMSCENRRDSQFKLSVRCSKLLETSPLQTLELAHNWLAIENMRQSTRFPVAGGAPVMLAVQVQSKIPGVGKVSGVEVEWFIDGLPVISLSTGEDGWCEYPFDPEEEGAFKVVAKVSSPYDDNQWEQHITVKVLGEDPWQHVATVTLAGKGSAPIGLVCFRDGEDAELRVDLLDQDFLDQEIHLEVTSESEEDLCFESDPPLADKRKLIKEGVSYKVRSNAAASTRFLLHVYHDELPQLDLPGLLLSRTLEGEGTLQFDEKDLTVASTAYPCLGAEHTLSFVPKSGSPLNTLKVAAKWADAPLDMKLTPAPGDERDLNSGGLEWSLDCRTSAATGETGLSLDFTQVPLIYPQVPMSLGHNRLVIGEVREATFDPEVGQRVNLELKIQSFYTQQAVLGVAVKFEHGETSEAIPTTLDGWAKFPFIATQPGDVEVIATVISPYDGPGKYPSQLFRIKVLSVGAGESDSSTVSPPTPPMSEGRKSEQNAIEIGEVREASFDPVVGESVKLGLHVRSSDPQRVASGVEVTFLVEQEQTLVKTDGEGWAHFAYRAEEAKDVVVVATLQSVNDGVESTPPHTFRFKSLAAGVWDDAKIQLNSEISTVWSVETLFPRILETHTITLSVEKQDSHLLGREISLGLKGFSSASELGITSVQPALGVARALTMAGLSWQITGTIGGAYSLQLEASRILNLSPVNAMSLGAAPLPELSSGLPAVGEGSVASSGAGPITG